MCTSGTVTRLKYVYFQDVKDFTILDVQERAAEHPTKYGASCDALPDEEFFILTRGMIHKLS